MEIPKVRNLTAELDGFIARINDRINDNRKEHEAESSRMAVIRAHLFQHHNAQTP